MMARSHTKWWHWAAAALFLAAYTFFGRIYGVPQSSLPGVRSYQPQPSPEEPPRYPAIWKALDGDQSSPQE